MSDIHFPTYAKNRIGTVAVAALLVVASCVSTVGASPPESDTSVAVDFQRDVMPLLSGRCFTCHGPDEETREGGLRLDLPESATTESDSGEIAIVPGDIEASEMLRRISSSDLAERMPPAHSGKTLSATEIEILTRWVDQGAKYEKHWAYVPVTRPELPQVSNKAWVNNPIDQFVLARLESQGLAPSAEASRAKIARRIYFDLIGLPPSIDQLHAFVHDASPGAVEQLAEELFASPHYGERMAIDWLDGARYADSNGYQNDFAREMWPWRDWVIAAFNRNMPYNQFTIEQLAGDLLPNPTEQQIIATGFNRNNRTVTEAGSIAEEWLVENVVDRVETTSNVFLGLTMGCCRCHDHKYDPISQKEFFEFYAFFNNIAEQGVYTEVRGNVAPKVTVASPEQRKRLEEFDTKIASLRSAIEAQQQQPAASHARWLESHALQAVSTSVIPSVYLPLDEDLWAFDPQGETVATPSREVANWTSGIAGKAVELSQQGIEYGQVFTPQTDSPYSMAVWVRPSSDGTLVSKMDSSNSYRGVDLLLLEGLKPCVHLVNRWQGSAIKVLAKQAIPKERWSHVVLTYDGSAKASGVHIFVNGVPQELDVVEDNLSGTVETDAPLRVGQRSEGLFYNGALTDLRLFDVQLDSEAVRQVLHQRLRATIEKPLESLSEETQEELKSYCDNLVIEEKRIQLRAVESEKREFEKSIPTVMVMQERKERRPTFILKRGEYHSPDKTQPVEPNVPDFLPPLPAGQRDRLALAKWIVDADNPLTARVVVNRLWARFFGRGIVKTTENFGLQADLPSHPQLLDWLATELVSSGWDLQHIQSLIVTSATYAQSSAASAEHRARDPNNVLLARGPRKRLRAELIRDHALAISGLLVDDIGGRSVMPYQPEGLWEELAGGAHEDYVQDKGDKLYRRSLYVYRKRTVPHPLLSTFDAPSFEICQVKRETTNTPLQSLALLNDTTYVEAARKLAERMLTEGGEAADERLAFAFQLATGRVPKQAELRLLQGALQAYRDTYQADSKAAKQFLSHGDSAVSDSLAAEELAAYAAVGSVILNLDESVTKD